MKKLGLILLLAISFIAVTLKPANAQTAMLNPNGFALDTGSQAAAEGPKTAIVKGYQKTFSIILKTTKISGTIAWQGSNDGVNFSTISTTALVDASTNYEYKEVDKGFLYYKALITQTGTSSLSYAGVDYVSAPKL